MKPTVALIDLTDRRRAHGPAAIAAAVRRAGAQPAFFTPRQGGALPSLPAEAYIVTGGPGSPTNACTWRSHLLREIARWAGRAPVLGICLGFQLIALEAGWPVRPLRSRRFGLYPLRVTARGRSDPLLAGVTADAACFEARSFAVGIGDPAQVLARAGGDDVTAARFASLVEGVAFHPEVTPIEVERFLASDAGAGARGAFRGDTVPVITPQRLQSVAATVIPGFLARVLCPQPAEGWLSP